MGETIPAVITATLLLRVVTRREQQEVNLMAIGLSQVINIRWRGQRIDTMRKEKFWKTSRIISDSFKSGNYNIPHMINYGCTIRPVETSVAAKQASKMSR